MPQLVHAHTARDDAGNPTLGPGSRVQQRSFGCISCARMRLRGRWEGQAGRSQLSGAGAHSRTHLRCRCRQMAMALPGWACPLHVQAQRRPGRGSALMRAGPHAGQQMLLQPAAATQSWPRWTDQAGASRQRCRRAQPKSLPAGPCARARSGCGWCGTAPAARRVFYGPHGGAQATRAGAAVLNRPARRPGTVAARPARVWRWHLPGCAARGGITANRRTLATTSGSSCCIAGLSGYWAGWARWPAS